MSDVHVSEIIQSIQPIITQCGVNDDIDIDELRENVKEIILPIFVNKENEMDKEKNEKFVQDFADKIVIFDPLDRVFTMTNEDGEEINQATTTQELKNIILESKAVDAKVFDAPFTKSNLQNF